MKVKFTDLAVGEEFTFNGVKYKKTQNKKISCCKTLNALNLTDNKQVMIKPAEFVEKAVPDSDNQ